MLTLDFLSRVFFTDLLFISMMFGIGTLNSFSTSKSTLTSAIDIVTWALFLVGVLTIPVLGIVAVWIY